MIYFDCNFCFLGGSLGIAQATLLPPVIFIYYNEIALSIWQWAKDRNIWLSTAFIPGVENTVADFHSRNFRDNTEWMLNPVVFKQLSAISFLQAD